jgi:hypothetical protein
MPSKTLAFFGATGDCAGFCLAAALKDNYDCIALARKPENLSKSMAAKGVSEATLSSHLTIVKGDVRDSEVVRQSLVLNGKVVDTIISGVGCTGTLILPALLSIPHDLTIPYRNQARLQPNLPPSTSRPNNLPRRLPQHLHSTPISHRANWTKATHDQYLHHRHPSGRKTPRHTHRLDPILQMALALAARGQASHGRQCAI